MPTGLKANVDGSAALQVGGTDYLTVTSGGNTTFTQPANLPNTFGFKNRIINGAMVIDQRNAGASVTPANNTYTLDRWKNYQTTASKYSVQRNAGSVTPPAGFTNYLGITSLSAYSVLSSDYYTLQQVIEGFNVADLGWGTANAQTVTLSFWVRSSLTGTFGGSLFNSAGNRSYPFSYTISAANTWTSVSVTIPGDTTGTWATDNTAGIQVCFGLGAGSTFTSTAGAWAAGLFTQPTSTVSVVGTNGATFYITGVQLEKGSTATSFDYRPYGTELALCQRYYEQSGGNFYAGFARSDGQSWANVQFAAEKRASPTVVSTVNSGTLGGTQITTRGFSQSVSGLGSGGSYSFAYTATVEL